MWEGSCIVFCFAVSTCCSWEKMNSPPKIPCPRKSRQWCRQEGLGCFVYEKGVALSIFVLPRPLVGVGMDHRQCHVETPKSKPRKNGKMVSQKRHVMWLCPHGRGVTCAGGNFASFFVFLCLLVRRNSCLTLVQHAGLQ